jgi:hypothetical protein
MGSLGASAAAAGTVSPMVRVAAVNAAAMRFFMLVILFSSCIPYFWRFCKQYNIGTEVKSREENAI